MTPSRFLKKFVLILSEFHVEITNFRCNSFRQHWLAR